MAWDITLTAEAHATRGKNTLYYWMGYDVILKEEARVKREKFLERMGGLGCYTEGRGKSTQREIPSN